MTTTRQEQYQLLASHSVQLAGIKDTIRRIEAAKADGSMDAYVADAQIERWSIYVAATQSDIDDCLANIAELDGPLTPDEPSAETSVDVPTEPIPEPTIVDDTPPAEAPKRSRKAAQS